MQICKLIDGQPTDIGPIPESIPGVSNPMLCDMVSRGWLIHVPSGTPHIEESHWEKQGDACVQVVDAVYSQEELAAQAAQAAEDEAERQADAAAAAAAQAASLLALESELDNAERITKGLALTILDELNRVATRIRAFDAAVAAATSLANLQTRVAALSAIPDRTAAQLKAAVKTQVQGL